MHVCACVCAFMCRDSFLYLFVCLFVWQILWAYLVVNCVLISLRYRCSARAYHRAQNDFLIINRNECRAVHYIMTHGICSMIIFVVVRAVLLYCVLCTVCYVMLICHAHRENIHSEFENRVNEFVHVHWSYEDGDGHNSQ